MALSAIVLDGHLKSALCVVRSLGKQDITVVCGAERKSAFACHSRFVQGRFSYVSPKKDQKAFIAEIIAQAEKLQYVHREKAVLFCFSDATALTIAGAYEELSKYVICPLPANESIAIASDKWRTYELAKRLAIPTIATSIDDMYEPLFYPAVVKNRHSIVWKNGAGVSGSASFVFSKQELQKQIRTIEHETGEHPLVQEFIEGHEYGVEMVCVHGEMIAEFVHKRIRSLSPRGGAAVVKETAAENVHTRLMRQYAHALIKELLWHGPVMIEFKIDRKDSSVKLMEINGRFWGSLPLAVQAGVDFPMYYYCMAQGESLAWTTMQQKQLRTRHFLGDCKWLLQVLFAKDPLRKILYPSRIRALFDFKLEIFKSRGDVFVWNDFKPSVMEYIDILRIWK